TNACQISRNGEYVLEIHFVRSGYLANFKCHRRGSGTDQHINLIESASEVLGDQRTYLLCLFIIGVVVTRRKSVRAEHYSTLNLLPKTKLASLFQSLPHVVGIPIRVAIFDTIIARKIGACLGWGDNVDWYPVFCMW